MPFSRALMRSDPEVCSYSERLGLGDTWIKCERRPVWVEKDSELYLCDAHDPTVWDKVHWEEIWPPWEVR